MTRHQKRTFAVVPALILLSAMAVCEGQPLTGVRPVPPRRSSPSDGLATDRAPRQFRPLAAPGTALVLPAAANLTEADRQRMVVRHPLFTEEDARRTKVRSLLFTPEDMKRTVWRFAAAPAGQRPLVTPRKPAALQPPRR